MVLTSPPPAAQPPCEWLAEGPLVIWQTPGLQPSAKATYHYVQQGQAQSSVEAANFPRLVSVPFPNETFLEVDTHEGHVRLRSASGDGSLFQLPVLCQTTPWGHRLESQGVLIHKRAATIVQDGEGISAAGLLLVVSPLPHLPVPPCWPPLAAGALAMATGYGLSPDDLRSMTARQ